ncbi:MAG: hypothetical protein IJ649_08000 [Oscillospiraceae bacterium]|nr:hypothetical protein [Oscillospiraceae bacterium]
MKRMLSILLVLCAVISLCGAIAAWELPAGTPVFAPGCVMKTDFGTFTVLDAGFCKKAQSIIQVSSTGSTINGVSQVTENRNIGYYTAKDGRALFAVTGVLHNSTDTAVTLNTLFPMVSFGTAEPLKLYGYPAVPFGTSEYSFLAPGADVEIVFAGTAPNAVYFGGMDLMMDFCGGTLGFDRGDLGNYVSMGFTEDDGKPAGDITEMTDGEAPAPAKTEEEPPHIDELRVEDVALALNDWSQNYSMTVKIRNLNYPNYDGRTIDSIRVKFRFLDESGDALPSNRLDIGGNGGFETLEKGQAGWAGYVLSGSGTYWSVDRDAVESAYSIVFDAYEIRFSADASGKNKTIKGTLSDPQVFLMDNILESRKNDPSKKQSPIAVENVSIDFTREQPERLKESKVYYPTLGAWAAPVPELPDSMTYARINFRITNLTKKEVNLADLGDHFAVQLNFDDGFLYSTADESECIYLFGDDYATLAGNTGRGELMAPPLAEMDVTLYLPVAKVVATQTDKSLVVSFLTDYTGKQQIDVPIR